VTVGAPIFLAGSLCFTGIAAFSTVSDCLSNKEDKIEDVSEE